METCRGGTHEEFGRRTNQPRVFSEGAKKSEINCKYFFVRKMSEWTKSYSSRNTSKKNTNLMVDMPSAFSSVSFLHLEMFFFKYSLLIGNAQNLIIFFSPNCNSFPVDGSVSFFPQMFETDVLISIFLAFHFNFFPPQLLIKD